jgi:hypothetical protein
MKVPNWCARMACKVGIYLQTNLSMLKEVNTHWNMQPSQKIITRTLYESYAQENCVLFNSDCLTSSEIEFACIIIGFCSFRNLIKANENAISRIKRI